MKTSLRIFFAYSLALVALPLLSAANAGAAKAAADEARKTRRVGFMVCLSKR